MGRWAQRRLRSTQGVVPTTGAARPSLVVASDLGGGDISLQFDRPVTVAAGGLPEMASLTLDGIIQQVTAVVQSTPTVITVTQGEDPSSGETLTWSAQPSWIVQAIDLTSSNVVA